MIFSYARRVGKTIKGVKPKPAGGRPSPYRAEFANIAYRHSILGATDADMAAAFEVSEQTINAWKQKHPKFLESIKKGKETADAKVAECLFKRATGYDHKAVKIFSSEGSSFEHEYTEHIPPDTTAQIFWLKNRQPGKWRNNPEVAVTVNNDNKITVDTTKPPEDWGAAELEAELKKLGITPILASGTTNGNGNGHHKKDTRSA